eukprot:9466079-Alexandrium_andersonii.AAC.1
MGSATPPSESSFTPSASRESSASALPSSISSTSRSPFRLSGATASPRAVLWPSTRTAARKAARPGAAPHRR